MGQLLRFLRELFRLDHPVAGLACDEAGAAKERLVEPDERLHALDLELVERTQHARAGPFAVGVPHAELRHQRVVEAGDLAALDDARVHAHAGPGGLPVARERPWRRQEAVRRVLGVDPALDRVPAEVEVLLAKARRLARRDEDLLADEVDPGDELGDGVLDLDARVHLEEPVVAFAGRAAPRSCPRSGSPPHERRRPRSCRFARGGPASPPARVSPRRASGVAAGWCSPARRGGGRFRGRRRAPGPRRGAGRR